MNLCEDCPNRLDDKCCHQSIMPIPSKSMQTMTHLLQQAYFERKNWNEVRWTQPSFIAEYQK